MEITKHKFTNSNLFVIPRINQKMKRKYKILKTIFGYAAVKLGIQYDSVLISFYISKTHPIIIFIQNECEFSDKWIT